MIPWIRDLLVEWSPYFIVAGAILLGFIYGEVKRANRYLRQLTLLAHIQRGESAGPWEDVGK